MDDKRRTITATAGELAAALLTLGPDYCDATAEFAELVRKGQRGEAKHGALSIDTDERDFFDEAIGEMQDEIWYRLFAIVRLRRLQQRQLSAVERGLIELREAPAVDMSGTVAIDFSEVEG